jgi:hypothetical protein
MAFVRVPHGADATLQLEVAALLNDMRGLVRNGVQIGAAPQDDVIAGRVRLGTHGLRGRSGLGTCVSLDRRDVVATERALKHIRERQGRSGRRHAA